MKTYVSHMFILRSILILEMYQCSNINFFLIQANVLARKSWKRTCSGFDLVTPLYSLVRWLWGVTILAKYQLLPSIIFTSTTFFFTSAIFFYTSNFFSLSTFFTSNFFSTSNFFFHVQRVFLLSSFYFTFNFFFTSKFQNTLGFTSILRPTTFAF